MSEVRAAAERVLDAPVERVQWALTDYTTTRPEILPAQFSDYQVVEGGHGPGTRVHWKLQATSNRVRDCLMEISQGDKGLVESDENSSMTTTWMLRAHEGGRTQVTVETSWQGAGGIKGFFEKLFAPRGMRAIYDRMLDNLAARVQPSAR